jgi:hypothetical protein
MRWLRLFAKPKHAPTDQWGQKPSKHTENIFAKTASGIVAILFFDGLWGIFKNKGVNADATQLKNNFIITLITNCLF